MSHTIIDDLDQDVVGTFDLVFTCPCCGQNMVEIDATNSSITEEGVTVKCVCGETEATVQLKAKFRVHTP